MANLRTNESKETMKKNFSSGFASFIDRTKLTPKQIAESLGVSESAVNGWKYGRSFPDVPNFLKLVDLGLSPLEVMSEELKAKAVINECESRIESDTKTLKALKKALHKDEWTSRAEMEITDNLVKYSEKKMEYAAHLSALLGLSDGNPY